MDDLQIAGPKMLCSASLSTAEINTDMDGGIFGTLIIANLMIFH